MSEPISVQLYTRITPGLKAALLDKANRMHLKLSDLVRMELASAVTENPNTLVDTRESYNLTGHTHAEPVYGPGSGYEPWAKDETEKVTP